MTPPDPLHRRQTLDPSVTLAMAMHAQPGVYAVLLGSGVSAGAGVPTGWGIVSDLVGRVAGTRNSDDPDAVTTASADPEAWWAENQGATLGYSSLLEEIASTPAARQGLLNGYFEPSGQDDSDDDQAPSAAHRAIAGLVKRGSIKVIVTTNFDRLMEQALATVGVNPQVISRPDAVRGMAPLAHAPATVIKLHGDYKDLGSLNTAAELGTYPPEWKRLIEQVLDEYGLLATGWSADWDTALVQLMSSISSRRYPLYWDSRSSQGENAKRLLANRDGRVITAGSADDLFMDLAANIDALDRIAQPPLTTKMAIARIKRYLPDPTRRIDLHDLVMDTADDLAKAIGALNVQAPATGESFEATTRQCRMAAAPLLELLATGVWHDKDAVHEQLWVDVLQHLVDVGTSQLSSADSVMEKLRRYPALLAFMTIGMSSVLRGRESLLIRLGLDVEGAPQMGLGRPRPAADLLHNLNVLHPDAVNAQPRWNGTRWIYPGSHQLKEDLRSILENKIADPHFEPAFHGVEYRIGLLQRTLSGSTYPPQVGEYIGAGQWDSRVEGGDEEIPRAEAGFTAARDLEPWCEVFGTRSEHLIEITLADHREHLAQHARW